MNAAEKHEIKDSGSRRTFSTGAVRDRGGDKPRIDLMSMVGLWKTGLHYAGGAEKYDARNWEKGLPLSEFIASAFRHLVLLADGNEDEDHVSAVVFNLQGYDHILHRIRNGDLPKELDDMPREKNLRNYLTPPEKSPRVKTNPIGSVIETDDWEECMLAKTEPTHE